MIRTRARLDTARKDLRWYYGTTPPLARKFTQRFADLFASLWGIFTQFNSRHNTITNCTVINIGRYSMIIYDVWFRG